MVRMRARHRGPQVSLYADAGSLVTKDGNNIGKAEQELEMQ